MCMAAHRITDQGWLDTPVHPLVGLSMFFVGAVSLLAVALAVASFAVFM
jgi:hypothetical protein